MDAPILHRMVTWVSRGCIVNTVRLLIFVRGVDWHVVDMPFRFHDSRVQLSNRLFNLFERLIVLSFEFRFASK